MPVVGELSFPSSAVLTHILATYTAKKRLYRHLRRIDILPTPCGSHSLTLGLCLCIFLSPKAYHHRFFSFTTVNHA